MFTVGEGYGIKSTTIGEVAFATCTTTRAGTYLIAQYTKVASQGVAVVEPDTASTTNTTTAYSYEYTFDADYSSITATPAKLEAFKGSVRTAVSTATSLPLSSVWVKDVRQGSVVVSLELQVPLSWSVEEVNAMDVTLTKNPSSIFTSDFLTTYGVNGVTLKGLTAIPPLPSLKDLNKVIAIGIGVGVSVGGALVMGLIVIVVVVRRKKMVLHPM